jgi:hypothetical protein
MLLPERAPFDSRSSIARMSRFHTGWRHDIELGQGIGGYARDLWLLIFCLGASRRARSGEGGGSSVGPVDFGPRTGMSVVADFPHRRWPCVDVSAGFGDGPAPARRLYLQTCTNSPIISGWKRVACFAGF